MFVVIVKIINKGVFTFLRHFFDKDALKMITSKQPTLIALSKGLPSR